MLVQPLDLGGEDAAGGELGEFSHGEELHGVGLAAHGGLAAGSLAEEEELVDVVDAGGVGVAQLVDECGELQCFGAVAGFLEDLADDGAGGGVVDVDPAAGEGPLAVGALAYQQDAVVLENAAAHVYLGGGVAFLARPETLGSCYGD